MRAQEDWQNEKETDPVTQSRFPNLPLLHVSGVSINDTLASAFVDLLARSTVGTHMFPPSPMCCTRYTASSGPMCWSEWYTHYVSNDHTMRVYSMARKRAYLEWSSWNWQFASEIWLPVALAGMVGVRPRLTGESSHWHQEFGDAKWTCAQPMWLKGMEMTLAFSSAWSSLRGQSLGLPVMIVSCGQVNAMTGVESRILISWIYGCVWKMQTLMSICWMKGQAEEKYYVRSVS
jgi:hypothetical protein